MNIEQQIESSISALDVFLTQEQRRPKQILDYLRNTPLPYIATYIESIGRAKAFDYSFRYLHRLGTHNVALAVGLCMNQYIALTIGALPVAKGSALEQIRSEFLQMVQKKRFILAVSSFDDFVRHKNDKSNVVFCETQTNGDIVCNGVKNFQSNITGADILLFSGILDGNKTSLFYTMLDNPLAIRFGEPIYTGAMADADTRSVAFHNLLLPSQQMVPTENPKESLGLHAMSRVFFAALAMAPYIGGAQRALAEAATFLNRVHVDGQALSELDGYAVDLGRAQIQYQIMCDLIERFTMGLAALTYTDLPVWLEQETTKAMALKVHITAGCESLVLLARKIIGTHAMTEKHIISRLSQQVLFAVLHPVINAKIEREMGRRLLSRFKSE